MFEIGRVCVKTAGRDAGKKCIIIDVVDKNIVVIDGETRRRKCNIKHLEPTLQRVDIKKDATRKEVVEAFKSFGIVLKEKKENEKTKTVAPKEQSYQKSPDKKTGAKGKTKESKAKDDKKIQEKK